MEAQFSKLASMESNISESLKVALLISSLSNMSEYGPMIASFNTLSKEVTTWNHFSMLFIEERKSLTMKKTVNSPMEGGELAFASAPNNAGNALKRYLQHANKHQGRCFKCGKVDHIMRDCNRQHRSNSLEITGTDSRKEEQMRRQHLF